MRHITLLAVNQPRQTSQSSLGKNVKLPAFVIGIGLVAIARWVINVLRASYLQKASKYAELDPIKTIELRYWKWSYGWPALGMVMAIVLAFADKGEISPEGVWIEYAFVVLCLVGAGFLAYRTITGRVTISGDDLQYREGGDRWTISAETIDGFSLTGTSFLVRTTNHRRISIPATFHSSELILLFLERALRNRNEIRRRNESANQAAEPTRTTVTPPAGAGDRASGARGSP